MIGTQGNDTYVVDYSADVVTENAGGGNDTVVTSLSTYTLGAQVENLSFSGLGKFIGIGNALSNTLNGGAGNDTLDGGPGGADDIRGNAGDDTVSYAGSSTGVIVDLNVQLSWDGTVNDQ